MLVSGSYPPNTELSQYDMKSTQDEDPFLFRLIRLLKYVGRVNANCQSHPSHRDGGLCEHRVCTVTEDTYIANGQCLNCRFVRFCYILYIYTCCRHVRLETINHLWNSGMWSGAICLETLTC